MKNKIFLKIFASLMGFVGAVMGGIALNNSNVVNAAESEANAEATVDVKSFTYQFSDAMIFSREHCLNHTNSDSNDLIDIKNVDGDDWYLTLDNVIDGKYIPYEIIPVEGVERRHLLAGTYALGLHQQGKETIYKTLTISPSTDAVSLKEIQFYTYIDNSYSGLFEPIKTEDENSITYTFNFDYIGYNSILYNYSGNSHKYNHIQCNLVLSNDDDFSKNYYSSGAAGDSFHLYATSIPGTVEYVLNTINEHARSYSNWDKTYKVVINVNPHAGNPYKLHINGEKNLETNKYEYSFGDDITFTTTRDMSTYTDMNEADVDDLEPRTLNVEYSVDNVNFTRVAPTLTQPGEYTVYYKITNSLFREVVTGEYNIVIKPDASFNSNKFDLMVNGFDVEDSITYNGKPQEVSVYYKDVELGSFTVEDVKEYDVEEELKKANPDFSFVNYFTTTEEIKFNVTKASVTILPNRVVTPYGTEATLNGFSVVSKNIDPNVAREVLEANGKFDVQYSDPAYSSESNVGNYEFKYVYTLNENANNNITVVSDMGTLIVEQARLTPVLEKSSSVYDGTKKTIKATVTIGENVVELATTYNTTLIQAGIYDITCYLPEEYQENYTLGANNVLEYEISKIVIDSSELAKVVSYNGSKQSLQVNSTLCNTNEEELTLINADTYAVTVSLIDKNNYAWEDGTSEDKQVTLTINKANVEKPVVENNSFVYDKQAHSLVIPTNDLYTISGNSASECGTHTVTVSLVDKDNYTWKDANSNDITYELIIKKQTYDMTAIIADVAQEYSIKVGENLDAQIAAIKAKLPQDVTMTVSGLDKINEVGKYDITFSFTTSNELFETPNPITSKLLVKWVQVEEATESGDKAMVVVESESGINPDYILICLEVKESESVTEINDVLTTQEQMSTKEEVVAAYEVSLSYNGLSVQPDGTLKIKLLIPQGVKNFKIIHIHGNEAFEIPYEIEGEYAVIVTDKLSSFVFVKNKTSLTWLIVLLAILLVAGIAGGVYEFLYAKDNNIKLFDIKKLKKNKMMSFVFLAIMPGHISTIIILSSLLVLVLAIDAYMGVKIFKINNTQKAEDNEEVSQPIVTNEEKEG